MTECYFKFDAEKYLPQAPSRGPWGTDSLSGSVILALLAHALESEVSDSDYMPARLTVDMYRLPDFSAIEIKTTRVRDGYRIKVVDAELLSNGVSMARATSQFLRKTENSPIEAWRPAPWQVPMPHQLPPAAGSLDKLKERRPIEGEMNRLGRKRMWIREGRHLVDDIVLSPFIRAAMVADLTNPWANSGEGGLGYINSDVTLYLHRLPVDAWLGMDVVNHQATDGIAIGECYLYDQTGAIGTSIVTGPAQLTSPYVG